MKVIKGTTQDNFFDVNPDVMYYDYVQDIYADYGREEASKIMWAIYLSEDPNSSFYNLPKEERRNMIRENYLKKENFDWDEFDMLIKSYRRMFLSKGEAMFKVWMDKMEEMTEWINEMNFETDGKTLQALMKDVKSYWDEFEKVQESFDAMKAKEKEVRGDLQFGGAHRGHE